MCFLGPVTRLDGRLVRPHDIEVLARAGRGRGARHGGPAAAGRLRGAGRAGGRRQPPWVQLTRGEAERLAIDTGATVWLRAAAGASTLAAPAEQPVPVAVAAG